MFGRNARMPFEKSDGSTLLVREVFATLQGEGPFAGLPAVFVRLGGCHLACQFCDTDFDAENSARSSVETIHDMIDGIRSRSGPSRLVVLTGGEPMRQRIGPLVAHLIHAGNHVQIETSGSFWPFTDEDLRHIPFVNSASTAGCSIVVSPKTRTVSAHVDDFAMAWKYVVRLQDLDMIDKALGKAAGGLRCTDPQDRDRIVELPRPVRTPPMGVYLQPCDEGSTVEKRATVERVARLCVKHGLRLSIQTHKLANLQ